MCAACWASILPLTPPLCESCGDALAILGGDADMAGSGAADDPHEPRLCPGCVGATHSVSRARAIGVYDGALRAIVHALKYDSRRSLARPLGELMRVRGEDVLLGATCVVPVPLHPSRRRERGFNQARDLAQHLGLPVVEALARVRSTAPQAQLSASERRQNLQGAFATTAQARRLIGATVVLVDDVSTTGATLEGCASALRSVGAADVRALTAARVVGARSEIRPEWISQRRARRPR